MYRKNTASQFIHVQGVDATTGGIKSGVTWTVRRCIDGTFAAATGTATEDGTTGWYKFAMSQADTNGNNIGFNFTGTGAVPQTVNIITTAADPTNATTFGLTNLDATVSSRLASASYTAPTNLTAAQIATGVWTDTTAGDFTVALSIGKSVMNGVSLGTGLTANALTNAPTAGDFTAAMKTSLNAATPSVTVSDKTGFSLTSAYDIAKGNVALTESYAALHGVPTLSQILFEIRGLLAEASVASTTLTIKKIDGSTTAETFTLNSATVPTSVTRAS